MLVPDEGAELGGAELIIFDSRRSRRMCFFLCSSAARLSGPDAPAPGVAAAAWLPPASSNVSVDESVDAGDAGVSPPPPPPL